tara:strand:+ start:94 stop:315 length:222 start_codon:yes stop_codon:yes gene_type:complete
MPELKQITVRLPPDLEAFWERKKSEIKRQNILSGKEGAVSNTMMFQALVNFWRSTTDIDDDSSYKSGNQSPEI